MQAAAGATGSAGGDLTGTYPNPTIASAFTNTLVRINDARLTDSRTPTGSAGGDLTGSYPNPTIASAFTNTLVRTNDVRLTDSRTPTGSAGGDLTGSYPNPTIASAFTNTLVRTNDARLTNSRTPTGAAGGDLTGTYPNPTVANLGSATNLIRAVGFPIDGGATAITTGWHGYVVATDSFVITNAVVIAHTTGSINVDIYKCTTSQFDDGATHPVAGDKITASSPVTISSGVKNSDSTLSGWTKTINAGDVLECYVNSCAGITWAEIILQGRSR